MYCWYSRNRNIYDGIPKEKMGEYVGAGNLQENIKLPQWNTQPIYNPG